MTGPTVEPTQEASVAALSDSELLASILAATKTLVAETEKQHRKEFGTWGLGSLEDAILGVGCDFETVLRDLLTQAWETLQLLVTGLEDRMSGPAIGLVRILLETAALTEWLTEPTEPKIRQ